MQNYFGPFYFGELKPYNSKYCSSFVLFLACSWYSRHLISRFCLAREIHEIKGTQTLRVLQYTDTCSSSNLLSVMTTFAQQTVLFLCILITQLLTVKSLQDGTETVFKTSGTSVIIFWLLQFASLYRQYSLAESRKCCTCTLRVNLLHTLFSHIVQCCQIRYCNIWVNENTENSVELPNTSRTRQPIHPTLVEFATSNVRQAKTATEGINGTHGSCHTSYQHKKLLSDCLD